MPRDRCCRSYLQSTLSRTQWGAAHWKCFWLPPQRKSTRGLQTQQHDSKHVEVPPSPFAQRSPTWEQWALALKTGPNCRARLRHTTRDTSLIAASRMHGTPPVSDGAHCQRIRWRCPATHETPQPEERVTRSDATHKLSKKSDSTACFFAVITQHSHTHSWKDITVPRPDEIGVSKELTSNHAEMATRFNPAHDTQENWSTHAIQQGWLEKYISSDYLENYIILWNQYVFDTEQIRILSRTSIHDQQISMFMQLMVKKTCAHNCSTS